MYICTIKQLLKLIHPNAHSLRSSTYFLQDWWDSKLPEESVLCCLSVIPKVLLAGAITLMDEAYFKLAVWLNDRGECTKWPK